MINQTLLLLTVVFHLILIIHTKKKLLNMEVEGMYFILQLNFIVLFLYCTTTDII